MKFIYKKRVYLKDINPWGGVYFSRFFEWQGEAREEFFEEYSPLKLMKSDFLIFTSSASMHYKKEVRFFDTIQIEVWIKRIGKASVDLFFLFRKEDTQEEVAVGEQRLVFVDKEGRTIPIPQEIKEKAKYFMED